MDSNNSSDEGTYADASYATKGMNSLLERLRPLVSKNALTAYLGTFLFFATAICMIFVSVLAYGVFYYNFIPQVGLERIVHLQFGDGDPWGTATLDSGLISSQPYDVHVELELPRTPSNLATGNFMLDLTLLSHSSTSARTGENITAPPISHSRRSAILTYASPLIDISSKVSFLPLYVLGWKREAERLVVQMLEGVEFSRGAHNVPESLRLELHSHQVMQVYSAKVTFRTRFTGLRWIMYQWRIPSFFVFSFMFWSVSMFSFTVSWVSLACLFNTDVKKKEEDEDKIKEEESEYEPTIKEEPSEKVNLPEAEYRPGPGDRNSESDTEDDLDQEVDWRNRIMTPESMPPEAAGTATESAEASGMQRRRNRLFKEEES
ncbi:seipin [Aspergillus undulatus]|uniref:seipin n=1 Tax=Aspergillus undulatus TaxID=1810928 RepID=UPI003CCD6D18